MQEDLSQFYFKKDEPMQSCLLSLRDIILNQNDSISESLKYGLPCFSYNKKHICYLWYDKKTMFPYILFADGNRINHPLLEAGDRKRMKVLSINPEEDIDIETIQLILTEALKLRAKKA